MSLRTLLVDALTCGEVRLDDEESHHAVTVLRLRVGDQIRLCDGHGQFADGVVHDVPRRGGVSVIARNITIQPDPATTALTIALAPPKADRLGDALRMLTELGVGHIWLLQCERANRINEASRLIRVVRDSLKQCRRARLPEIRHSVSLGDLHGPALWLADPLGARAQPPPHIQPWCVAIGPEGGFTESERHVLLSNHAQAVRLAEPILRIETAATAAAALFAGAWTPC